MEQKMNRIDLHSYDRARVASRNFNRRWRKVFLSTAAAVAMVLSEQRAAWAAFNLWAQSAGGSYDWSTSSNWLNGIPNSSAATADFYYSGGENLAGTQFIDVANQTCGTLYLGSDPTNTYAQALLASAAGDVLYMGTSGGTAQVESFNPAQISVPFNYPLVYLPVVLNNCNFDVGTGTAPAASNPDFSSLELGSGFSGGQNFKIDHAYVQLDHAASYSGTTTLDDGYATLALNAPDALPSSSQVTLSDPTDTLQILNNNDELIDNISGSGTVALGGGILEVGNFNFSGSITGSASSGLNVDGSLLFAASSSSPNFAGTVDINGVSTAEISNGTALGTGTLIIDDAGLQTDASFSLSNPIKTPAGEIGDFFVTSATTLTLNGVITVATGADEGPGLIQAFTGVAGNESGSGGTLVLANSANSLQELSIWNCTVQFSSAGDINTDGGNLGFDNSISTLELLPGNGAVSTSDPVSISGQANLTVDSGSTLFLTGNVSGSGAVSNVGTGILVLAGNNSYAGGTTVGGNVSVSSDVNLGAAGAPINFSETLVSFLVGSHRIFIEEPGTLLTTSSFSSNRPVNTGPQGGNIDVAPSTVVALTGTISGTTGINKLDAGTLILTGNNAQTGGTTITAGTVEVRQTPTAGASYTTGYTDPLGAGTVTLNGGTVYFAGDFNPASQQILAATGYNRDVVIENAAHPSASPFDTDNNFGLYEKGANTAAPLTGLPTNSAAFTSASNSAVSFQLQPYTAANVLFLPQGGAASTGQLMLSTPERLDEFSFLAASTIGATPTTVQLNFADGTTTQFAESVPDWFSTTTAAYTAGGRVTLSNPLSYSTDGTNPRLYEFDYALSPTDADKIIDSVSFTNGSSNAGNTLGIFALSGSGATPAGIQVYANTFNVTADSTLQLGGYNLGSANVWVNNLTIGSNTLYVAGKNLAGATADLVNYGSTILNGSAVFDVAAGVTVQLDYVVSGSGSLTKNNSGVLYLAGGTSNYSGPTVVNGGSVIISNDLGPSLPVNNALTINTGAEVQLGRGFGDETLSSLTINGSGFLDLQNNHLLINYGSTDPIATIRAYLKSGYQSGAWRGPGIDSYAIGFYGPGYSIGYADSADPNNPAGLVSDQIEIKYTLAGDLNLDGEVNGTDFSILAANFGKNVIGWDQGDINYDGVVNGADFALLASNFGKTASGADIALPASDWAALDSFAAAHGLLVDVPEPASATLLLLSSSGCLARRRRK
jgi:autotransporter-associated beta strand protein